MRCDAMGDRNKWQWPSYLSIRTGESFTAANQECSKLKQLVGELRCWLVAPLLKKTGILGTRQDLPAYLQ